MVKSLSAEISRIKVALENRCRFIRRVGAQVEIAMKIKADVVVSNPGIPFGDGGARDAVNGRRALQYGGIFIEGNFTDRQV